MYPTHTLIAQVAADRTADAQRQASARRQRRSLGSARLGLALATPAARSATVASRRKASPASA